ncbi:MAG: hypothetical protein QW315_06670 [Candidatus Hadarchaeum sp.]
MADWYFIPITLQYLIGSGLIFVVSFFLIMRNPKSWIYRSFFLYGLFAGLWILMAFLHRNAPTAELSADFITLGALFGYTFPAFLLITFLMLKRQTWKNLLVLIPASIMGVITLLTVPFKIFWTEFGWSYAYATTWYFTIAVFFNLIYILANLIVGINLIRAATTELLRKKYRLLLISYFVFYVVAISITNILLIQYANYPPLGGIISTFAFVAIAWALSLKFEGGPKEKSPSTNSGGERSYGKVSL